MPATTESRVSRRGLCCSAVALCCLPALRAQAQLLAESGLATTEVAPGIHVSQGVHAEATADNLGAIANCAFVMGTTGVAVIDTGGCALWGQRLREAIRSVTPLPVRYVINSHVHPDHVFGNSAFEGDGADFIGHAKLPAAMAARGQFYLDNLAETLGPLAEGTRIVPPTMTVADSRDVDLGDRMLRVRAHPTAHTDNDLSVFDTATATLFTGDLLFMTRIPALDGSLKGWLDALAALRETPAKRVVPGHGPAASPWPDALDDQERYLRTLLEDVRDILARGGSMEQAVDRAGGSERGRWLLFDDYHARNVVTAFAELEWE